jgi:two-component system response regulator HydG
VASILIVDDQQNFRFSLAVTLKREGHRVAEAANGQQAVRAVEANQFDIVITDLRMPGMDGIALLREVKKVTPQTEVVVMTAFGSVDTAVDAMRHGACDYITKPFQPEELLLVTKRTLEKMGLTRRIKDLESLLGTAFNREGMVGNSPPMQEILKLVASIGHSEGTVLISGESGTGKELVARAIHANSARQQRPFIALNCATMPDTLQESEMFGYVRGAFTGAVKNKPGLIEEADTGTLFLDEIALASPSTQSKLLRFLQYGEFRRLGDTQERFVDVRLIAATNSDLAAAIKQGAFRQDLFYRINVIPIHVPPLRERREDIPLLAEHFLRRFSSACGRKINSFEDGAMDVLMNYDWPGNVRELENAVEYGVMLTQDQTVRESALPQHIKARAAGPGGSAPMTLERIEAAHILQVLESTSWNQDRAAGVLGIGRTTLWRKLKSYGIAPKKHNRGVAR